MNSKGKSDWTILKSFVSVKDFLSKRCTVRKNDDIEDKTEAHTIIIGTNLVVSFTPLSFPNSSVRTLFLCGIDQ